MKFSVLGNAIFSFKTKLIKPCYTEPQTSFILLMQNYLTKLMKWTTVVVKIKNKNK